MSGMSNSLKAISPRFLAKPSTFFYSIFHSALHQLSIQAHTPKTRPRHSTEIVTGMSIHVGSNINTLRVAGHSKTTLSDIFHFLALIWS